MRKKVLILLLVGIFIVPVVSCKKAVKNVDDNNNSTAQVGSSAISFVEIDSKGNEFKLESLRGKVILFCLSTMWCGPCRAEAPKLEVLYQKYKDQGFEIVQCIYQDENGASSDIEDINRWLQEFGLTFVVINDPDRSTVNIYPPPGVPYNIIIDKNFVIQYMQAGFSENAITQLIENLL